MNVLVVTPDKLQAAAIEARFAKRLDDELTFEHVTSGGQALKRLARSRADLIISASGTDDLSGLELLGRVRQLEPEVAFILLDRSALSRYTPTRFDAVLDTLAHPADVLEAAFSLLVSNGQYQEYTRPFHGAFRKGKRPGVKISGTLEVMTLFDLVLSLTQKRNSGRLYLLIGAVEAMLAFQQGRFVHAESHPSTEFYFEPAEVRLPPGGATLHTSVQEKLLRVAVELDHHRELAR